MAKRSRCTECRKWFTPAVTTGERQRVAGRRVGSRDGGGRLGREDVVIRRATGLRRARGRRYAVKDGRSRRLGGAVASARCPARTSRRRAPGAARRRPRPAAPRPRGVATQCAVQIEAPVGLEMPAGPAKRDRRPAAVRARRASDPLTSSLELLGPAQGPRPAWSSWGDRTGSRRVGPPSRSPAPRSPPVPPPRLPPPRSATRRGHVSAETASPPPYRPHPSVASFEPRSGSDRPGDHFPVSRIRRT